MEKMFIVEASFGTEETMDLQHYVQAIPKPLFQGNPVEDIVVVGLPQTLQKFCSSIVPTFDAMPIVAPKSSVHTRWSIEAYHSYSMATKPRWPIYSRSYQS